MANDETLRRTWDRMASDYQLSVRISLEDVHYGPLCEGESVLGILGDVAGKDTLEVGCGGGQNTIALSRWGARAEGVDFSTAQIEHARKTALRVGSSAAFSVGDARHLERFSDSSKDIVLSVFASEYLGDLSPFLQEVHRIMRPGAIFVLSDLHPFVSGGDVLEITKSRFWDTVSYFKTGSREFDWEFSSGLNVRLKRFHRTLGEYVAQLRSSGLWIEDIRELGFSSEEDLDPKRCPYWDESLLDERHFWRKVPYTILFKCKKR